MTDSEENTGVVARMRRQSLAHCNRMVGSAEEAEDLVQE
jgi:DNA-directed RNA polymerase specialized sigma24 family protein